MPLPSVTYNDYMEQGGTLGEDDFKASFRAAVSAVRDVIGFNEPQDEADEAAYICAVCAAVEVDYAHGASGGIGEAFTTMTLGKFSVSTGGSATAASSSATPYAKEMHRAISSQLLGSSLLYQGIA